MVTLSEQNVTENKSSVNKPFIKPFIKPFVHFNEIWNHIFEILEVFKLNSAIDYPLYRIFLFLAS